MAKIGLHHLVHRVPVEAPQDTDFPQPVHENHIGHEIREFAREGAERMVACWRREGDPPRDEGVPWIVLSRRRGECLPLTAAEIGRGLGRDGGRADPQLFGQHGSHHFGGDILRLRDSRDEYVRDGTRRVLE